MLYFMRAEVHQPDNVTAEQLTKYWKEEAAAALGAVEAGAIKGLWKVAGQRVVLAILDVPDHDTLDQIVNGLPFMQTMGSGMEWEFLPIREYADFAAEL